MDRLRALMLLQECTGDEIWSVETCRNKGVPELWIDELCDCFESGFESDRLTIYVDDRVTNQYRGVRDVDLAQKLGFSLGLPVERFLAVAASRRQLVLALQEAAEEF